MKTTCNRKHQIAGNSIQILLLSGFLVSYLLFATPTFAGVDTGPRKIVGMGCHLSDPTCWAIVDGASFGPAACPNTTQVRWDSSIAGGKTNQALLMMAYASGKRVNLSVSNTCWNGSATFDWLNVTD